MSNELKSRLGLPTECLLLLISGGGHGSRTVNQLILEISPELLAKNPSLWLVHVTGEGHADNISTQYSHKLSADTRKRVKVIGFSKQFSDYTAAADLVVARAGATTLAELALLKKPAVIIPSPFLAGGHQLKNAEELTTKQATEVLPNDVSPQKLFKVIDGLIQNKQRREQLAHNIGALSQPQAANKIADILLEIAEQKNVSKAE